MMSGIRVTYSGLISLAIGLSSVITGLIFTIIVTRILTPQEFGTWGLIGSLIMYVLIIDPIISYWATREIARGKESAKTALIANSLFSVIAMIAYLVISLTVFKESEIPSELLIFGVIMVPVTFVNRVLTSINLSWKPQATSYGILTFEISKIPFALILVYFLEFGLEGAILSTTLAYVLSIIVLAYNARSKLRESFDLKYIKKWFKLSWIPMYRKGPGIVFALDVTLFTIISGSVLGVAYYSSALAVSILVGHAGLITQALYPKLLSGGGREFLHESLTRYFYFGFPLAAISITFAKPALFLLNPEYDVAVLVVIIMTIRTFFYKLSGIFQEVLQGIEKIDIGENLKFIELIKSKLFIIPTTILIQYSLYVAILAIVISLFHESTSQIELVIYWSTISLSTQIPFTIYFFVLIKNQVGLSVDVFASIKYLGSSILVFGVLYIIIEQYLIFKESIFDFFPDLVMYVSIGIVGYLGITYLIDTRTRVLIKSIVSELKNIKNS